MVEGDYGSLYPDSGMSASDRVALGRCRPRAPTDPYVLALEHTVLQITGSLHGCKPNARCARRPVGNAGAGGGNGPSSSSACGCGDRATSANAAETPSGTAIRPQHCTLTRHTLSDRLVFHSASVAAQESKCGGYPDTTSPCSARLD